MGIKLSKKKHETSKENETKKLIEIETVKKLAIKWEEWGGKRG